jgi:hypothetical protein
MAGMERFGLDWQIVGAASGVAVKISDYDSVAFYGITTGAASFALTLSATFGSGYAVPTGWAPVVHYYTNADAGVGTGNWSDKVANNAAGDPYHGAGNATVPYTSTIATTTAVLFIVLASQVPVGYPYIKCTGTNSNVIIIGTPLVQRRSNFLVPMSAA